jgi:hypothetical protein
MMMQLTAKFDKKKARKAREVATVKAAAAPIMATTVTSNTNPGCLLLLWEVNAVYKFGGKQCLLFTF